MEAFGGFHSISRRGHVAQHLVRQWIHILHQLVDGFGRISFFLSGLVDSDPEVVASISLCVHARRQQRQWHAFYWFCLS